MNYPIVYVATHYLQHVISGGRPQVDGVDSIDSIKKNIDSIG